MMVFPGWHAQRFEGSPESGGLDVSRNRLYRMGHVYCVQGRGRSRIRPDEVIERRFSCFEKLAGLLAALAAMQLPAHAFAQSYPERPVRFIVTFAPGGGTDIVARLVAQKLTDAWGAQVVVDNRGGGGGVIGTELAARAAPDGYTWLFGTSSGLVINPLLRKNLPYDPVRDFAPVTLLTTNANMLVVNASVQAASVKQLISLAQAAPGKLNYATAGAGSPSHLVMELFKSMTRTSIVHVPYKGAGPAMVDVLGGQVQMTFNPIPPLLPHVKSGKLRALGVSSATRTLAAPDVPTIAEAGVPGFEYVLWYSMFVPARTPKAIVDVIQTHVARILDQPEVRDRLIAIGADPRSSTPAQLEAFVKADTARLRRVIEAAGLKSE